MLQEEGEAPSACTPDIMTSIVKQHLESPAMWAIFPLQDLLGISPVFNQRPAEEETINDPTNPRHYWRYRMHIKIEELLEDQEFVRSLRALLQGRSLSSRSLISLNIESIWCFFCLAIDSVVQRVSQYTVSFVEAMFLNSSVIKALH